MSEKTCSDYVESVLREGGKWTNVQIQEAVRKNFGLNFQNNTIAKYLSFLIKSGAAGSERVEGGTYDRYWMIRQAKKETPNKIEKFQAAPMSTEELKNACLKAVLDYPEEHTEHAKIMNQYYQLDRRSKKVA